MLYYSLLIIRWFLSFRPFCGVCQSIWLFYRWCSQIISMGVKALYFPGK